ncbi:MAG TPA: PAS domain S-box protein [Terriglobales bacterium]|nr:PAS domain S-box protein [Terriglobales bacterium]
MPPSPLEHSSILRGPGAPEERFQQLLLRLAGAAARENSPASLIQFVCRELKIAFSATAAFFCTVAADGSYLIERSDSEVAGQFAGLRFQPESAPSLSRPAQHRTAVAIDDATQTSCVFAAAVAARSLLAAPVVAASDVGVLVVVDQNLPHRFTGDDARKISSIAAQTGLLLGSSAVTRAARESQRRSDLLVRCAQMLHATVDVQALCDTLSENVRAIFNAHVTAIALAGDGGADLASVAAPDGQTAAALRELYASTAGEWLRTLVEHACSAEGAAWFPLQAAHAVELQQANFPVVEVICAPLRTARRRGALLAFGASFGAFANHDLALLGAVAEFGALAVSNCDLYARANAHAEHLQRSAQTSGEAQRASQSLELLAAAPLPLHAAEFMRELASRAQRLTQARSALLARATGPVFELTPAEGSAAVAAAPAWRLGSLLAQWARRNTESVISGPAEELLGKAVAVETGWREVVLARLATGEGEALGVLCIADPTPAAHLLPAVRALAVQGELALENMQVRRYLSNADREWEALADSVRDLIVVHDDRRTILRVNAATADLLGTKPHELTGVSMQVLASLAGDALAADCRFCAAANSPTHTLTIFDRQYLVSGSELQGKDVRETVHVLRDVSDTFEAEQRYRELFQNVQEGIFFAVPQGGFIEVNEALVKMLGYASREELLLADPARDIFVDRDARARFYRALEQRGSVAGWQEPVRRKDGRIIFTLQNVFVVRDARGNVVQHRGLMLDISDLRNSQVELQRERDFNRQVLENTRSIILVTTPEGAISYANPRALQAFGQSHSELIGKSLLQFVAADHRRAWNDALSSAALGQHTGSLDLQLAIEGGGQALSANISPVRDPNGDVTSLVIVLTDLTETAALHSKLAQTEKLAAVGQLVSGVAHEVNNPLTAILGFSDLLLNDSSLPEHAKKDLRVIMQEAQRTKTIVQNLLSFARQLPPQREPVDINALLRKTVHLRAYDLNTRRIEVVERFTEPLPRVIADPHQLQQVFLNVLNNAYDAVMETGRPGRIEVSTAPTATHIEIAFRDNGPGVSQPERIFDPFFTTKEAGKGTGLGLSICYGIIRQHGGEIMCRNNQDAPGATFTLRLPVSPGAEP